MMTISLKPEEVWDYIVENPDEFESNEIIIAQKTQTSLCAMEGTMLEIVVGHRTDPSVDDQFAARVYYDGIKVGALNIDEETCTTFISELYEEYGFTEEEEKEELSESDWEWDVRAEDDYEFPDYDDYTPWYDDVPDYLDSTKVTDEELDEDIDIRESDLTNIVRDVVDEVFEKAISPVSQDDIESIKDDIIDYLHKRYPDKLIYRPMFVENEDGEIVFHQYV